MNERDGLDVEGSCPPGRGSRGCISRAAVALEATERMRRGCPPCARGRRTRRTGGRSGPVPDAPRLIYLNAANLAPSPYVVSDTVAISRGTSTARCPAEPRQVLRPAGKTQSGLASTWARRDEIAIVRNTTRATTQWHGLTLAPAMKW